MLPGKEAKGVSSKTICYFFLKKIDDGEVDVAHPGVRLYTFEPFHWKHLLSGYI